MSRFSPGLLGGGGLNLADLFQSRQRTGTGAAASINFGIDMTTKSLCLIKQMTNVGGTQGALNWYDTERGAQNSMSTNISGAQVSVPQGLTAFTSTGINLGTGGGSGTAVQTNILNETYINYAFKAAPKFFDLVTWTGNGSNPRTLAHSLGVVPAMMIVKCYDNGSRQWAVYHKDNTAAPETDNLVLNSNAATVDDTVWGDTLPTATDFTVSVSAVNSAFHSLNLNGNNYVAYLFADNPTEGISCGTYTGNGSATGPVISLPWRPQFLLVKRANVAANWVVYDSKTDTLNPRNTYFQANLAVIQQSGADMDFNIGAGFQPKTTDAQVNANTGLYVYMAIKE